MKRNGFTIVELLIVITVMGILLTLGVVNLSNSQINARDAERKADIESIAIHLDIFYRSGSDDSTSVGKYPSTLLASSGLNFMTQTLRDLDVKSITAPDTIDPTLVFIPATNNTQTTAGVTPQPTINQYVYQPIKNDGSLCTLTTDECRKFNLYYRLESDNIIYTVTGKNQ